MKNLRNFNPIVLARNGIAVAGLMSILNIIVDALHFAPFFPLSLYYPSFMSWFVFNVPKDIASSTFLTLENLYAVRPYYFGISAILIALVAYSYFRSTKKPGAIKIGFGVIVADTVLLLLNVSFSFSWIIEVIYHAFLLFYIFKGIRALKEANRV